jgi:hypothetical protein
MEFHKPTIKLANMQTAFTAPPKPDSTDLQNDRSRTDFVRVPNMPDLPVRRWLHFNQCRFDPFLFHQLLGEMSVETN